MTVSWRLSRLGNVCGFEKVQDLYAGLPYVGLENIESGTGRFLGTANAVSVKSATFRFSSAHVLYGRLRPYLNKVLLPDFEGHCSTEIFPIRPGPEVSRQFLFHWLSMDATVRSIDATSTGARMPRANMNAVLDLELPVPPLAEQRRIVAILDEAFEGIATAKANAEKNLRNTRELFERQLAAALRHGREGWVETTIGEACTLKSGTTVPVEIERLAGDVPYVKVAEMTMPANRDGVTTSIRFLDRRDIKSTWLIPAGAVIFPKRGGAILTNKKRRVLVDMCADLNIMAVIPSSEVTSEFLYLYFLAVDMRKLGTGSSIPQINNYDIAPLLISFPRSRAKQMEVGEALRAAESECQALAAIYERKLAALDELKKSLLHQAFSGAL